MASSRSTHSLDVGRFGESVAARFLVARGLTIVERNVFVGSDELDLIVRDGRLHVAIEVKTSANGDDPIEAIDDGKADRIRRAVQAYSVPIHRIDAIAVRLDVGGVTVRWLKAVI